MSWNSILWRESAAADVTMGRQQVKSRYKGFGGRTEGEEVDPECCWIFLRLFVADYLEIGLHCA